MNAELLVIAIFLPIAAALVLLVWQPRRALREIYVMTFVIATSVLVILQIFKGAGADSGTAAAMASAAGSASNTITVFNLTHSIPIAFRIDGISKVFGLLLACLWPIASLWSFEYMYHEKRENGFFVMYTACYGITLGICFAANLVTMYLFYELLTLITVPLIMHSRNQFSKPAGMKYLAYSIAGATAAFAGVMLVYHVSGSITYTEGGLFTFAQAQQEPLIYLAFILMFFGFGVKAAVFPFYEWLPAVGIAPTPVTALLHAVAVVKSGCFAIIRMTYYIFGAQCLRGSWAQNVALIFAAFTIAFGSIWAYRETHFKRRLAMSTVSNLSYIVFGAMLLNTAGLAGALLHMLFHGVMKICLFFTAGTCHIQGHADYVTDIKGYGRRMPVTFAAYTIASLALIGVPPLCGFFSKYRLGVAAAELGTVPAYLGMAALIVSAVYTALYLLTPAVKAYFPEKNFDMSLVDDVKDPGWRQLVPFVILALACIALGVFIEPITDFILNVTGGLC